MMDELAIIENKIYEIRGQKVMLDFDLAEMYGVETRVLKQAVRRNIERFPIEFMFELTKEEAEFAREKQKVKIELQKFADEHNDPKKLELDGENHHYRIGYDIDDNDLVITRSLNVRQDGIYFSSKEIAADAANKIGVKRILKYLFDVGCEVDE